jgi:hypothetical protein
LCCWHRWQIMGTISGCRHLNKHMNSIWLLTRIWLFLLLSALIICKRMLRSRI